MSLYGRRVPFFVTLNRSGNGPHFPGLRLRAIGHLLSSHDSRDVCPVSKAIDQRGVVALWDIGGIREVGVKRRSRIHVPVLGKMRMIRVDAGIHDAKYGNVDPASPLNRKRKRL